MSSHLDIPQNAMELTLKEIILPAIGLIGTIMVTWGGFFFKAYLKSNEDKFQDLTNAIKLQQGEIKEEREKQQKQSKEESKEIIDSLTAIKDQVNRISNQFTQLDYKQLITDEDVKGLLQKTAQHSLDIQRIKDFHNSHHKDDKIQ